MTTEKQAFANTMADHALGTTAAEVMSECYRFGMCWGCEPDCPVYLRGECEVQEENKVAFAKRDDQHPHLLP